MKSYLFLLAWVSGSDSNCGEDNNIHAASDLFEQYNAGNDSVFALEITAPNSDYAYDKGITEAFFEGYTAHDSVSDIVELDQNYEHPGDPGMVRRIELS